MGLEPIKPEPKQLQIEYFCDMNNALMNLRATIEPAGITEKVNDLIALLREYGEEYGQKAGE